jgi:ribose transport system ATP-binding protein
MRAEERDLVVNEPSDSTDLVVLRAAGLVKRYPGSLALDNVDFDLRKGEIHVLVGENGAGKSTLIKILAGVIRADAGEVYYRGKPVALRSPHEAHRLGIAAIHQEINLAPDLSVAENLLLGQEPTLEHLPFIDRSASRTRAGRLLSVIGSAIDLAKPVGSLPIAQQQIVAIAKALSVDAQVLILDEPTAMLSGDEIDAILSLLRDLKAKGISIIYVSHRLNEALTIGDRVTALRDGRRVGTRPMMGIAVGDLIGMIVGRSLAEVYPEPIAPRDEVVLAVTGLHKKGVLDEISFAVRSGEVLAISGIIGSGKEELAHALFGDLELDHGTVNLEGRLLKRHDPQRAIKIGIGLVPSDRKGEGLLLSRSSVENMTVSSLLKYCTVGFLKFGARYRAAQRYQKLLGIRGPGLRSPVRNLSGGNQQKVVLAKWLDAHARALVLIEPTHGLDIGAKAEVYKILQQLAGAGAAVIVVSSELTEVLGLAHRVLVMRAGAVVAEFPRGTADEAKLLHAALEPASP